MLCKVIHNKIEQDIEKATFYSFNAIMSHEAVTPAQQLSTLIGKPPMNQADPENMSIADMQTLLNVRNYQVECDKQHFLRTRFCPGCHEEIKTRATRNIKLTQTGASKGKKTKNAKTPDRILAKLKERQHQVYHDKVK